MSGEIGAAVTKSACKGQKPSDASTTVGIRRPQELDPRPVVNVLMPGGDEFAEELGGAPIQTADWLGF